jgi:hypothetical protein
MSIWTLPKDISQYSEPGGEDAHVSWLEVNNFSALRSLDGKSVRTTRDLLHIAREPKHDITEKTYFLKLTNFNFSELPNTITGIEAKLSMNRFGRITDDTVQLTLNDELIGENQATLDTNPIKLYGSENSLWDTTLTPEDLQNPLFGIVLRFKSHPRWPHKNSALIDAVEIRVYYKNKYI